MNTRISDAAVEAAIKAYENAIVSPAMVTNGDFMRAALETVLPHLQPAKPEAVRLRDELRERAAFEAWARGQRFGVSQSTQGGQPTGHYELKEKRITWRAWQAALASVQPSPAGQGDISESLRAILPLAADAVNAIEDEGKMKEAICLYDEAVQFLENNDAVRQPVGDR